MKTRKTRNPMATAAEMKIKVIKWLEKMKLSSPNIKFRTPSEWNALEYDTKIRSGMMIIAEGTNFGHIMAGYEPHKRIYDSWKKLLATNGWSWNSITSWALHLHPEDGTLRNSKRAGKSRNSKMACGVRLVGVGSGVPVQSAILCRNDGSAAVWRRTLRDLEADQRQFVKQMDSRWIVYHYLVLAMTAMSGAVALHQIHTATIHKEQLHGRIHLSARGDLHDTIQRVRRLVMARWKSPAGTLTRNKPSRRKR